MRHAKEEEREERRVWPRLGEIVRSGEKERGKGGKGDVWKFGCLGV